MKCLAFSIAALLIPGSGSIAQNLVPNPSFEDYFDCPDNFGQWLEVVDWTSYYTFSADYFNVCAMNDDAGIPINSLGYQFPADGNAYMGIFNYLEGSWLYREVIGCQLTANLQPGVPVCLSFKAAMGGYGSWDGNSARYTCKGVGVKFFTSGAIPTSWAGWQSYLFPNTAALYMDQVPMDTALWYEVSGTYIPDSAYSYLLIANFFDDTLSTPVLFDSTYGLVSAAYTFIDDVRVSYDLEFCGLTGEVDRDAPATVKAFPNPFDRLLYLELPYLPTHGTRVELCDLAGRVIFQHWIVQKGLFALEVPVDLPPGPCFLRVHDPRNPYSIIPLLHLTP